MSGKIIETLKNPIPKFDCNDPVHQAKVAGDHGLLEEEFHALIAAFFGLSIPAARTFVVARDIAPILTQIGTNCKNCRIVIFAENTRNAPLDPGELNSNDDLRIEPDCSKMSSESFYSVALFNGIMRLYAPTHMDVYKAQKNGKFIHVFKAYGGPDGGVYFGDFSDVEP